MSRRPNRIVLVVVLVLDKIYILENKHEKENKDD